MYTYNLGQRFAQIVKENGEKPALIFCDDSRMSYLDLDRLSNQMARFLIEKGIKKRDVVAIQNSKTPIGFSGMVACIKIGAIYTNFDFTNPPDRIHKIFSTAKPRMVLADTQMEPGLLKLCQELHIEYADNTHDCLKEQLRKYPVELEIDCIGEITGDNPVYIMFTSGSTGIPKGVLIKQESVLHLVDWGKETFHLTPQDIMTNVNPIYFDNSVFDFYCSVWNGIPMVAFPKEVTEQPKRLMEVLDKNHCTVWFSVPSFLIYLMNLRLLKEDSFSSIRVFSFGGEGYPKELLIKLYRLYQNHAKFYNVYGPTEGTCICSAYEVSDSDFEEPEALVALGKIAPNFDYEILNEADERTLVGELCLMGPQLALGYYNDRDRTSLSFVQNPLNLEYPQIMYRTGDLVEKQAEKLYFRGRADNQIKHMGYRIELEEVEAGLIRLSYVKQCAAVHGKNSKGFFKLAAFLAVEGELEEQKLREQLRCFLPGYMIPNLFLFVEELPKNANGKVDRVQLKRMAELK